MRLVYKQLTKQILRNKVFVIFLLLLSMLTSLSFFFIRFSVDGNMSVLNSLSSLTENQQLYKNALNSNIKLAYSFYISTIGLTAFVFAMFFYRFFRSDKKQLGCLKSLGFKDRFLRYYFVTFVAVVSIIGALLGLVGGYFLSDVQIGANTRTYAVTGLIKEVSKTSLMIGTMVSTVIFCMVAFLCYTYVRGKEPGVLITGKQTNVGHSNKHRFTDALAEMLPVKKKFPIRIALRKPVAILLILTAVMAFIICMVLGCSLNISSQKVFTSQTIGHNYEYDTHYAKYHNEVVSSGDLAYLDGQAKISANGYEIEQTIVGLYNLNKLYELQDTEGSILSVPDVGTIYINPGLTEIYGIGEGDTLALDIEGTSHSFIVAGIAQNAKSASIYADAAELSKILGVSSGGYNGILSIEEKFGGETSISKLQRIDNLNRNSVSNKISAVINQVIGFFVGCILIFLALYVNFQDNTRDILILRMMGFRIKEIRKLLIDVYQPIIWAFFLLTLGPGILIAKGIQKSLSISTHDYMPFGTNIVVILVIFSILSIIYWLGRSVFTFGIKHIIAKEGITEYTSIES
jgi:putative ABC transport system permease protein